MIQEHSEKMFILKPKSESWNRTFLHSPEKDDISISNFKSPEL